MTEVNNLTRSPVKKKFIIETAEKVLKGEEDKSSSFPFAKAREGEKKAGLDLSIALVGQRRMKNLNKRYRDKDAATDVLSFGEGLGEIVICLAEVKNNAKICGATFKEELARILIHGVLHVLGYDHEKTLKEAEIMRKKEEFYIKICQKL